MAALTPFAILMMMAHGVCSQANLLQLGMMVFTDPSLSAAQRIAIVDMNSSTYYAALFTTRVRVTFDLIYPYTLNEVR